MLSRCGSNRRATYQLERRYSERTVFILRMSAGSSVASMFGPMRARDPMQSQFCISYVHHSMLKSPQRNGPYFLFTSKTSQCILPFTTARNSHRLENVAGNGPLKCRRRYHALILCATKTTAHSKLRKTSTNLQFPQIVLKTERRVMVVDAEGRDTDLLRLRRQGRRGVTAVMISSRYLLESGGVRGVRTPAYNLFMYGVR